MPPGNTRRTTSVERVALRGWPSSGAELKAWRHKMFYIFHVLQSDMAFLNQFLLANIQCHLQCKMFSE